MENNYCIKKDLENINDWSEKKTADFLVWDNVRALESFGLKDIEKKYFAGIDSAAKRYEKYRFLADFVDIFWDKLLNRKKGKKIILFQDNRYPGIADEVKKYYSVKFIASSRKDRLFVWKNLFGYLSVNDFYQFIYDYWSTKDFKPLQNMLEILEKKLKKLDPDFIVLYGDDKPIERAIILISKKLGIPTINIQSVLLIEEFPLFFGALTDYIFVWSNYFKEIFIRHLQSKRDAKDIYILGYPVIIKSKFQKLSKKNKTIYYLGENYENYNEDLLDVKIKTLENLNEVCKKLKLKFIYRPHPGDDREFLKDKLPRICFSNKNEKLTDSFNKGDVFISFDSTTLAEAMVYDKICLQLMNYPIKTDNLEKKGARVKSFATIKDLECFLENMISSTATANDFFNQDNSYFIETFSNPGGKFLELLTDIENII